MLNYLTETIFKYFNVKLFNILSLGFLLSSIRNLGVFFAVEAGIDYIALFGADTAGLSRYKILITMLAEAPLQRGRDSHLILHGQLSG